MFQLGPNLDAVLLTRKPGAIKSSQCHSMRDSEAAEQDPEQRDSCCGLTLFHLLREESKTSLETEDDLAIVYQYKFQTNERLGIKTRKTKEKKSEYLADLEQREKASVIVTVLRYLLKVYLGGAGTQT